MVNHYPNNIGEEAYIEVEEEESSFDVRLLWDILRKYKYWFLASVLLCVGAAFVYLRYSTPMYSVSSKILIKDKDKQRAYSSSLSNTFQELGFMNGSNGFDNELEVLNTVTLNQKAVKALKLYTRYFTKGHIRNREIYSRHSPYLVDMDSTSVDSTLASTVKLVLQPYGNGLTVEVKCAKYRQTIPVGKLPVTLNLPIGDIHIERNADYQHWYESRKASAKLLGEDPSDLEWQGSLIVTVSPLRNVAFQYAKRLSVEPTSKTTTVAALQFRDNIPQRGADYMEKLVEIYNSEANEDNSEEAKRTAEFIQARLNIITQELNMTESELEEYEKSSNIVDFANDARMNATQSAEYEAQIIQTATQQNLIQFLDDYVNESDNYLKSIPSNIGINDASLTATIAKYNEVILERTRLLRTVPESNPIIQPLTSEAETLLTSIKSSIRNLNRQFQAQIAKLEAQRNKYEGRLSSAPTSKRTLADIGRQQEVKAGLYLMLLQKNEENAITMASAAYKAKVIEEPIVTGPVSPKGKLILIIALVVGVLLPYIVYYIRSFFKIRIEELEELQKLTTIPVLGSVPFLKTMQKIKRTILVQKNRNSLVVEVYRTLRSNLPFILKPDEKVLLFTSSVAGEGKTSIAANLGASIAFSGKKVLIIGLDIRKPRLAGLFGFSDTEEGISSYLAGSPDNLDFLDSLIHKTEISENLDVLAAGPIPPNPAELLERENLKTGIDHLRSQYDYILLDTAPIGLVSDTMTIGKCANATLFVVRANYSLKSDMQFVNELSATHRMPNVNIIFNGVKEIKSGYEKHRYGSSRYGYGTGYSYGYGMDKKGKVEEI